MTLQGSLLGFALFKMLPSTVGIGRRWRFTLLATPLTPKENIVVQTVASSVGCLPLCAGAIGVLPAFTMLDPERDHAAPLYFSQAALWAWTCGLAFAGIFFASPLREPMILKEQLPFPSGTATAQLVSMLHNVPLARSPAAAPALREPDAEGADAPGDAEPAFTSEERRRMQDGTGWRLLLGSLALSFGVTILALFMPVVYALPLFDVLAPYAGSLTTWGWWYTPSFSYIGQGMIMGLPTSVSMTFGALVGWAVLSPLAHAMGWATGEPLDDTTGGRSWVIWVSLAVMASESISSVVALGLSKTPVTVQTCMRRTVRAVIKSAGASARSADTAAGVDADTASTASLDAVQDDEPPARRTSPRWVVGGLVVSTVAGVLLVHVAVGTAIAPWATVVAFVLASLFSVLAVQALGETDLNPVSGVAKISQLLFGVLQPHNVVANLVAGAISESGAFQAGELMQDYKTGHLVGVAPWNQFRGQLLGSVLGIGVTALAYHMYRSTYTIPGPQFPAPMAAIWLNLARLINLGELPPRTPPFMLAFALFFTLATPLRAMAHRQARTSSLARLAALIPSGVAFSIGVLNTPNFSLARLTGGLLAHAYARRKRVPSGALGSVLLIVVASGFVLGEGIASIVALLLTQAGVRPLSCWGCRAGCAGGCS